MTDSSSGQTLVMSSFGANSLKENNKATFWKKSAKTVPGSIKPVYGAQHPPRQEKPSSEHGTPKREMRGKQRDSFQDFQDNTQDAWDDGDDDLITMANSQTMSKQDIDTLALQVINNHSLQTRMAANGSNSGLPDLPASPTHLSAQNTPTHSGSGMAGPGVGVRMNHWHQQRGLAGRGGQLMVAGKEESKAEKFKTLIATQNLDLEELRKHSWSGIPIHYRPTTWKILSGYLPASIDRRELTLERKRKEYYNFVDQYFDTRHQDLHQDTFRQIHIDIPRMNPLMALFQEDVVQQIFERILYIWAIRHPASGYVQGINDLVTPFFVVFLSEYVQELESPKQLLQLPKDTLRMVEADCFWCFSKLLDGIQDNYTFAQPGIQVKVNHLKELTSRIDSTLHKHLERHHIEYLQFSFRWMNNLLMREMPLRCTIRLWDTYLSEPEGFASFHLYVCAAFLCRFSEDLRRERDFQGLMLMLQNLPTHQWSNEEINLLLAEAYKLKFMFADAPKHLAKK